VNEMVTMLDRQQLDVKAVRERRVHPGRDEKVLTSWNGLMLAAFAEAGRVLDIGDYRKVAEQNAEFLLRDLRQENGRVLRTWERRPERFLEGPGEGLIPLLHIGLGQ
jgi:uncharacterized protein YyaL (SSP411 family)